MTETMTLEQEIAHLQNQIEQKKAEIGASPEAVPQDKEILRDAVREKIQQYAPVQQSVTDVASVPAPVPQAGDGLVLDPELQQKVQELVNTAFAQTIDEAIRQATALKNPALLDAFHDVLVDELYDHLLERKKLEAM